jgi:hypothetical protein
MLTSLSDDEALFQAIMAGASGYLLKQIKGTDLIDSIRRVATGRSLLEARQALVLLGPLAHALEDAGRDAGSKLPRNVASSTSSPTGSRTGRSRRGAPGGEDGQQLRVEPPREARDGAADPGWSLRGRAG